MKKYLAYLVVAAAVALPALSAHAENNGALVIQDGVCVVLKVEGGVVPSTQIQITATGSENDNVNFHCKAQVPAPGIAKRFTSDVLGGVPCFVFVAGMYHLTSRWEQTVSASGQAMLSCHFDADEEF